MYEHPMWDVEICVTYYLIMEMPVLLTFFVLPNCNIALQKIEVIHSYLILSY